MQKISPKVSKLSNKTNYKLEIILPVYNEKKSIPLVLKEWSDVLPKDLTYRFIVCEDGSTDGTKLILKKIKRYYPILLNQKNERRGYGGAVIDGIKAASAEYILCIDSDGQCDPHDFLQFWKERKRKSALIGWRKDRRDTLQRRIFSHCFKFFFGILFPSKIHDPSAPFVLFPRNLILNKLHDLTYLSEGFWWGFVGMCVKQKIPLQEIVIHHRERLDGKTNVYKPEKIPAIAMRNIWGLIKLRFDV